MVPGARRRARGRAPARSRGLRAYPEGCCDCSPDAAFEGRYGREAVSARRQCSSVDAPSEAAAVAPGSIEPAEGADEDIARAAPRARDGAMRSGLDAAVGGGLDTGRDPPDGQRRA